MFFRDPSCKGALATAGMRSDAICSFSYRLLIDYCARQVLLLARVESAVTSEQGLGSLIGLFRRGWRGITQCSGRRIRQLKSPGSCEPCDPDADLTQLVFG